MMNEFMKQSYPHTLDLTIILKDKCLTGAYGDGFHRQMRAILSVDSRWRCVFFYGDVKNGFHEALGVFGDLRAPLLEKLVVYKGRRGEDEDEHSLRIFKCKAPLLKHLTIRGTSLMFCESPLSALLSLNHANSLLNL